MNSQFKKLIFLLCLIGTLSISCNAATKNISIIGNKFTLYKNASITAINNDADFSGHNFFFLSPIPANSYLTLEITNTSNADLSVHATGFFVSCTTDPTADSTLTQLSPNGNTLPFSFSQNGLTNGTMTSSTSSVNTPTNIQVGSNNTPSTFIITPILPCASLLIGFNSFWTNPSTGAFTITGLFTQSSGSIATMSLLPPTLQNSSIANGNPGIFDPCTTPFFLKITKFISGLGATTTQIIAGTAGNFIRICSINASNNSATPMNITFVEGTGTNCATSQSALTGKFLLNANTLAGDNISISNSFFVTNIAGDSLCITGSAAGSTDVTITEAQF